MQRRPWLPKYPQVSVLQPPPPPLPLKNFTSQHCLILIQVNPTLTSCSPPWLIISPSTPIPPPPTSTSQPFPSSTPLFTGAPPPLPPPCLQSPPSILYIGLISLSPSSPLCFFWPPPCRPSPPSESLSGDFKACWQQFLPPKRWPDKFSNSPLKLPFFLQL